MNTLSGLTTSIPVQDERMQNLRNLRTRQDCSKMASMRGFVADASSTGATVLGKIRFPRTRQGASCAN